MKKILGTVTFVFATLSWLYSQDNCKLKIDKDGIKVYTCNTDTSRFKSIVTDLTVNTTLEQLMRFVLDVPNYTRWQYNTTAAAVIREISPSEQLYHTVIKAPWPVTNRDMVVHMRSKVDADQKGFQVTTDSESGIIPEKEDLTRVPASHAQWTVKENGTLLTVRYTMQIDPGGSVPAWLANWVCANAPYLSFKKLKEALEK